jgi:hypothetical protein
MIKILHEKCWYVLEYNYLTILFNVPPTQNVTFSLRFILFSMYLSPWYIKDGFLIEITDSKTSDTTTVAVTSVQKSS